MADAAITPLGGGGAHDNRSPLLVLNFVIALVGVYLAGASQDVVVLGGEPIGRLVVDRRPGELRIVDLALVPERRGRGIGTRLLRALLDEADTTGAAVVLHVEPSSPARRLYRRFGFEVSAEDGAYARMERPPQANTAS